jgi:cytochrome c oxidase subunit 2
LSFSHHNPTLQEKKMKVLRPAALLGFTVLCGGISAGRTGDSPKRIEIVASRFTYKPDVITLKKGEPVVLVLRSTDVTHGLKVAEMNIKTSEVKKGKDTELQITPEEVGHFTGKCAHFCGKGHGSMMLQIDVVP